MRRIGSNIRKQNSDAKSHRIVKNIIPYRHEEKARSEYPKRIVSPPEPSPCCTDENREVVGTNKEMDGFKFAYKICKKCGYALKFYFPANQGTSEAVQNYRQWKRYMAQ